MTKRKLSANELDAIMNSAELAVKGALQKIYAGIRSSAEEYLAAMSDSADKELLKLLIGDSGEGKFKEITDAEIAFQRQTIHKWCDGKNTDVVSAVIDNFYQLSPIVNPLKNYTNLELQIQRAVAIEFFNTLKKALEQTVQVERI